MENRYLKDVYLKETMQIIEDMISQQKYVAASDIRQVNK